MRPMYVRMRLIALSSILVLVGCKSGGQQQPQRRIEVTHTEEKQVGEGQLSVLLATEQLMVPSKESSVSSGAYAQAVRVPASPDDLVVVSAATTPGDDAAVLLCSATGKIWDAVLLGRELAYVDTAVVRGAPCPVAASRDGWAAGFSLDQSGAARQYRLQERWRKRVFPSERVRRFIGPETTTLLPSQFLMDVVAHEDLVVVWTLVQAHNLHNLLCMTAADGSEQWEVKLPGLSAATDIRSAGRVLAYQNRQGVGALDWNNGKEVWSVRLDGDPAGLALARDTLVAATSLGVFGIDPESGNMRWTTALEVHVGRPALGSLGADENLVAVYLAKGKLAGISLDGDLVWRAQTEPAARWWSPPFVRGNAVVCFDCPNSLDQSKQERPKCIYLFDSRTGQITGRYAHEHGVWMNAKIAVVGDTVVIPTVGKLLGLDVAR